MNNDQIARATLRYIDEFGLEAVSFRKISDYIKVPTMTICNRFGSKDNLLRAALAAMLDEDELEVSELDKSWDESLRRVAHHNRDMALAHPNAFPLFLEVPPFESPVLEYTQRVFSTHQEQNLPEGLPYAFLSIMHSFLSGFQMAERYSNIAAERDAATDEGLTPEAQSFIQMFNEEAFDRNLDIIIHGLADIYHLPLGE